MIAVVGPDGILRLRDRAVRVALGRAGIRAAKHEGDGATPAGHLPLRRVLFRADRVAPPPRAACPREPIAPRDGWCDDPRSPEYNRAVTLPHPDRHERLWRDDPLYDVIGVLGWNDAPPRPELGSAIFLHVATADLAPTEGCIAMALPDLLALLADGLTAIEAREA
jgi:L,D-peptidoglycan transpeptidase YkuD (ErfK/YbiS/YcfS/YnhG family)